MSLSSAVVFKAAKTSFEVACVGEGEGLGDLDDETAFDKLYTFRIVFRVDEVIRRAWFAA